MNDNEIKDFIKDYAEILRTGVDISCDLPLYEDAVMTGGLIRIKSKDGRTIGVIFIECGDNPSMPISPAASTYSKLIITLLNKYYESAKNGNCERKTTIT